MARITKYGAQQLLLSMFSPELSNNQTTLWFALTTAVPPLEVDGSNLSEVIGGDYARTNYSIGGDFWSLEGATTLVNTQPITWNTPTEDWGRIAGWALCTESFAGSVIASGELSTRRFIPVNAVVTFPANSVRLRMEF